MKSPVRGRVSSIIKTMEGEYTPADILKIYNSKYKELPQGTITSTLARISIDGKIDVVKRGVYVTNEFGMRL